MMPIPREDLTTWTEESKGIDPRATQRGWERRWICDQPIPPEQRQFSGRLLPTAEKVVERYFELLLRISLPGGRALLPTLGQNLQVVLPAERCENREDKEGTRDGKTPPFPSRDDQSEESRKHRQEDP
jgi:hypothetical protein